MKYLSALIISAVVLFSVRAEAVKPDEQTLRLSMVKIFSVSAAPDYQAPWRVNNPSQSTGSGCIIKGGRILTAAHVVSNVKYIQVQFYGDPERYPAYVEHIAHEVDLAILKMQEPEMLDSFPALEIGPLPNSLDDVLVYGYPTGGNTLSITKGVLSRIEFQSYAHGLGYYLAGQIDAAINPGNSGGPVIKDSQVAGIAMQKRSGRGLENIGYMVPSPLIEHFLKDIADGSNDGFPIVGFTYQKMESPSLRAKYKMNEQQTGVLVIHVNWNSSARGLLKPGDVILSIDGHPIANNGTIEYRENERFLFAYYVHEHQAGEPIDLRVLRRGRMKDITVTAALTGDDSRLVKSYAYDEEPEYFLFGGMLVSKLSMNIICLWNNCSAPDSYMEHKSKHPKKDKRDIAVILRVLPAKVNNGYHYLGSFVIDKVNGASYATFEELHEMVVDGSSPFITFTNPNNQEVVIERELAQSTHEDVKAMYGVTRDRFLKNGLSGQQ